LVLGGGDIGTNKLTRPRPEEQGGACYKHRRLSFSLVLFDLDGTLVDSLPDIAAALNASLAAEGLAPLPSAVVRSLVGEGVHRLAEKALAVAAPRERRDAAALAQEIVRRYAEHPCGETRLYPGIPEALATLHARGARLAVVTNKYGPVARALLAALPLGVVLDDVVGDGDGHPRKPAPDAARALMAKAGVSPSSTLMVGDGLPDLAMARAAGCPVAAVTWGYTDRAALAAQSPDHLVDEPGQLVDLRPT
jgi:phosphoglycolate phosphatase